MIPWSDLEKLPWRQRNAEVEKAVRAYLARRPPSYVVSTMGLAQALDTFADNGLAQLLSRMAKHMQPLATHDGETITRYKRQWRRWQWRGQAK